MASDGLHHDLSKALDNYQASLAMGGDQHAFALLYKRWHPRLLRLALRLTRNPEDAQDVMQDSAITIAKNIYKLEKPESFSAWAYTIVRRRSADHIKRAIHHREIKTRAEAQPLASHATTPEDRLTLKQVLESLPQTDRAILTLFYSDGFSGKEIALALGVPIGTVKSRLFTAREKLKHIYLNPKKETGHD